MKPNELMIDDWTYIVKDYGRPKKDILKIDALDLYKILDGMLEVEPIPLTTEILEKNGWVYIAEDKVFYSENLKGELPWIYYITDGSNEIFRMQDFCNLQYVHQLQHALRLCGIEKEIIL